MTKEKQQLEALKKLISIELSACSSNTWPRVCQMQSTEKGYKIMEDMIVRLVALEGMPIGSAIAHLEQELTHQSGT